MDMDLDNHALIGWLGGPFGPGGYPGWPGGPFALNVGADPNASAPAPAPQMLDGGAAAAAQQHMAMMAHHSGHMGRHQHAHHAWGPHPYYGPGPYWGSPGVGIDPNYVASLVAAKQSNLLYWDQPNQGVDEFLGFESDVEICPGDTVDIQAVPQIIFKPQRLLIPSTIGGQLVVRQLLVGNRPCFAGSGSIPGLAFAENSTYVKFNAETAWVNQPVTLTVTNISDAKLCFTACLIGPGAQPGNPRLVGGGNI